jgi:hypothetical protein
VDLTTLARVKSEMFADKASADITSDYDTWLSAMITSVSQQVADFIDTEAQETERTETYDVDVLSRIISLRAWPVDSTADFTVKFSSNRDFDSATATDSDLYDVNHRRGTLRFDTSASLQEGYGTCQVTYTGGLGTSAADVIQNRPHIAKAVELHVKYLFQHREQLGISNMSAEGASVGFHNSPELIPAAKALVQPMRRLYV